MQVEFHEWNILWYFAWIMFRVKIQNARNPQNKVHAKINQLQLYLGTSVKHLILHKSSWK